ncbi:sugar ABC transporter permease [Ktedonosporobacter rubrisoli]|uniref:Sugar ABC transporter permease n=1 Tax=Ktedonosporobacter rubrisoli TaxID=2509675 RepID=A0A4P6JKA1_KTERU|nr:sugar ABC transporter permease [Ktedonosporobacter rubrisoli]QBD75607.1 sugar ABC transporter permease [Ktedonosporobacter rubrisoli]
MQVHQEIDIHTSERKARVHAQQFKARLRTTLLAYAFLLPSFIGLLAFLLLPIIAVAVLSFFNWNLLSAPRFIGLQNYNTLFHSQVVSGSLLVTIGYVLLNIPAQTVLALLLALLMNKKLRGIGIFRTLYVVPWMATPVAMGIVWRWIFDPANGALNTFLGFFGLHNITWLSSPQLALPAIAAVNIWQYTGYNMLFFLAGLQSISQDIYEAASIDGASPAQAFFRITLPLLNPTMFFVLVTDIIGSFQVFDTVYVMTNGGPGGATNTFNFYIFRQAFEFFHAGYASALSMVLFGVLLLVTLVQALYFRKRTVYEVS